MKKIRIAVCTKNENYGKALARGLSEESEGLEIKCVRELTGYEEYCDIVLTDVETLSGPQILTLSDENPQFGQLNYKNMPVADLLKIVLEKHLSNSGRLFIPQSITDTKIIGIKSRWGGTGVTSIAIMLGRLLALNSDGNTIYLNFAGSDDYQIYAEAEFANIKSQQELLFRLESGSEVPIQKYAAYDPWGLYMLKPAAQEYGIQAERIVEYLCKTGFFSHIIIDAGKNSLTMDICHKNILIQSCRDARCDESESILNFCDTEGDMRIRIDDESFEKSDDKIHISMEGIFAEDVERIKDMYTL